MMSAYRLMFLVAAVAVFLSLPLDRSKGETMVTKLWELPRPADEGLRREFEILEQKLGRLRALAAERPESPDHEACFLDIVRTLSRYSQRVFFKAALLDMIERERHALRRQFPRSEHRPEVEFLCTKIAYEARYRGLAGTKKPTAEGWPEFLRSPEAREIHARACVEFLKVAETFPESREAGLSLVWAVHTQRLAEPDDMNQTRPIYDRLMARWKDDRRVMSEASTLIHDVRHVLEGAPAFSVLDTNGNELSLDQYRGNLVLLDFWATWCGPSVGELPTLKSLHERFADRGLVILGIALEDDKQMPLEEFRKWLAREGISWPQYYDGKRWGNKIAQLYGVGRIPYALLLDRSGKVVMAGFVGPVMEKGVTELVDKAGEGPQDTE